MDALCTMPKRPLTISAVCSNVVAITSCYSPLLDILPKVESSCYTVSEASKDLANIDFGTDICDLKSCTDKRLIINNLCDAVNFARSEVSPELYTKLQRCQSPSMAVERFFSSQHDQSFLSV